MSRYTNNRLVSKAVAADIFGTVMPDGLLHIFKSNFTKRWWADIVSKKIFAVIWRNKFINCNKDRYNNVKCDVDSNSWARVTKNKLGVDA